MRIIQTMLAGFCTLCAAIPAAAQPPVTIESLLTEMTDRERLARLPDPWYTCAQASSYDHDSTAPGEPGWFANWDRSQFIRTEQREGRTEHVLMDAAGPGAIVRFWATWHGPRDQPFSDGTLRIYLDHAETPVIEGPVSRVLSGRMLAPAPLSQFVSPTCPPGNRAHNLYLPIPYAEHCLVTYETDAPMERGATSGGEALYYQINYRTYEPGTAVESLSPIILQRAFDAVQETVTRLALAEDTYLRSYTTHAFEDVLHVDDTIELNLNGPGAIRTVNIRIASDDLPQALRSTIIEMTFDDERTVWCPLGAFFASGYQAEPYDTWYASAEHGTTFTCRWIMPFESSARIVIRNLIDQRVHVAGFAVTGPWRWDDRSMHFHTNWRQYTALQTKAPSDMSNPNMEDLNYVTIEEGPGVYVGDSLCVFNAASAWWGEGDEKIYVDGETMPSHIGTGTEDYYGYAWCRPEPFSAPFHAQPTGAGNFSPGQSVNTRFRVLDAIPFRHSLRFDMEMWHWVTTKVNYAPTTFWYARPGATSNVKPDPVTAALPVVRQRSDLIPIFRAENAIEGEDMTVQDVSAGVIERQEVTQFRWSGDQQLWWRDGAPGDTLTLTFNIEDAGRYRVHANLTKASDYGIVTLQLNSDQPGERIDRFHPDVQHDLIDLGVHELREGENMLRIEIVGANPEAVPRHMFGIDYLRIEPTQDGADDRPTDDS